MGEGGDWPVCCHFAPTNSLCKKVCQQLLPFADASCHSKKRFNFLTAKQLTLDTATERQQALAGRKGGRKQACSGQREARDIETWRGRGNGEKWGTEGQAIRRARGHGVERLRTRRDRGHGGAGGQGETGDMEGQGDKERQGTWRGMGTRRDRGHGEAGDMPR
jgi:hypothetical protein